MRRKNNLKQSSKQSKINDRMSPKHPQHLIFVTTLTDKPLRRSFGLIWYTKGIIK